MTTSEGDDWVMSNLRAIAGSTALSHMLELTNHIQPSWPSARGYCRTKAIKQHCEILTHQAKKGPVQHWMVWEGEVIICFIHTARFVARWKVFYLLWTSQGCHWRQKCVEQTTLLNAMDVITIFKMVTSLRFQFLCRCSYALHPPMHPTPKSLWFLLPLQNRTDQQGIFLRTYSDQNCIVRW